MIQKGKIRIGGLQNKIFNLCLMLVIGVMIIGDKGRFYVSRQPIERGFG